METWETASKRSRSARVAAVVFFVLAAAGAVVVLFIVGTEPCVDEDFFHDTTAEKLVWPMSWGAIACVGIGATLASNRLLFGCLGCLGGLVALLAAFSAITYAVCGQ